MVEPKRIAKTPRERFMRAAEDELAKFVRKEFPFPSEIRNPATAEHESDRKALSMRAALYVVTLLGVTAMVFASLIVLQRTIGG